MKTHKFIFCSTFMFFGLIIQKTNAQATTASTTNTVTATAYLGSGSTSNFDVIFKRNNFPAGKLATTSTNFGLNSSALPNSSSFGVNAGQYSSGIGNNTYIGQEAGKGSSATPNSGNSNTFLGFQAGINNSTGSDNVFLGVYTGTTNKTSSYNVLIGNYTGTSLNSLYGGNVMIGHGCGYLNSTGYGNVFLGNQSGYSNLGISNVFLGASSGYNETGSNKLYVANTNTSSPLIWGDFANSQLKFNGKVGIGGNSTTGFGSFPNNVGIINVNSYNLFVKGGILTDELRVALNSTWADYVFKKDYDLKPLSEVEKYIIENGHLSNVPSADKIKKEGIDIAEMLKIQQEKIEELTLYIIEQEKRILNIEKNQINSK